MKNAFNKTVIALFLLFIIFSIISYSRGYRFNFTDKKISSTGILAISSSPKAAKVYINGKLKGVTDLNLTLKPATYAIEVKKEGYMPFKTTVALKGEIVETIDPLLFPNNPSLSPLSNLGIIKAVRINQSDKIVLISENDNDKDGIYLFDSSSKPITIFTPLKVLILKEKFPLFLTLKNSEIVFSPDYKQFVLTLYSQDKTLSKSYLISTETENQELFDVTDSKETLIDAWDKEKTKEIQKILETYPKEIQKIASSSLQILSMSPDQTKILYKPTKDLNIPFIIKPPLIASNQTKESRNISSKNIYVYDKKEDKNFKIEDSLTNENDLIWYSDSKRLVFKENEKISIAHYDGTNKQVIYSGPLDEDFFSVNADGKLLILTNLNPKTNILPDLYIVGIR